VAASALAQVQSANTVGYTTQAIAADTYYLIGTQFETVGGTAATIAFDDLISMSGVSACSYDDQETDGAEIDVLVGGIYAPYYYINDAYDANNKNVGKDCWAYDGYECTAADAQALGSGFWLKVPAAAISGTASLKTYGQVSAAPSLSVSFPGNNVYTLISNPFPVATGLQNVTTAGITACAYDDQENDGAEIDVLVGGIYVPYYFINDAYDADDKAVGHDCWAFDGYECTGTQISAGEGFWIKSPSAGTLTFSL
jgi:hypothetical protein